MNHPEPTYACPTCQDLGVTLHTRAHPKLGANYTATHATPCPDCSRGASILAGWTTKPKPQRPGREPNRKLSPVEKFNLA